MGYLAQKANEAEVDAAELGDPPGQVARVIALVADGSLSTALARQAVDGVLETGHDVDDGRSPSAGSSVVSDTGALEQAADEAIAANPDVAEKVRGGKVPAVGALVGAVMKATRGQADAAAVRADPARAAGRQRVVDGRLGRQRRAQPRRAATGSWASSQLRGVSPSYERLCLGVADDPEVIELHRHAARAEAAAEPAARQPSVP